MRTADNRKTKAPMNRNTGLRKARPVEVTFELLQKGRFSEQVAHLIRERIFHANLEGGSRLPRERPLAEELGVSRSFVREALRILDAAGYVSVKKGARGAIFVSRAYHKPISDSLKHLRAHGQITVNHLFGVRLKIEPFMAQEAVRHATSEDITKSLLYPPSVVGGTVLSEDASAEP